jgi:hypothetical protein
MDSPPASARQSWKRASISARSAAYTDNAPVITELPGLRKFGGSQTLETRDDVDCRISDRGNEGRSSKQGVSQRKLPESQSMNRISTTLSLMLRTKYQPVGSSANKWVDHFQIISCRSENSPGVRRAPKKTAASKNKTPRVVEASSQPHDNLRTPTSSYCQTFVLESGDRVNFGRQV